MVWYDDYRQLLFFHTGNVAEPWRSLCELHRPKRKSGKPYRHNEGRAQRKTSLFHLKNYASPEMEVTDIFWRKSRDFVSC